MKAAWTVIFFGVVMACAGCESQHPSSTLEAAFNYTYLTDNLLEYSNASSGDYYSATWDFGNGTTETTTDKKKRYEIYYPDAGDYSVSLKVLDYSGNTDQSTQTINIAKADLLLSFTAEIDPDLPNYVILTNTTQGEYDSFQWAYRNIEIQDELSHRAYFPLAGRYEVELRILKNGNLSSEIKTVDIAQDDPDYIEGMTLVWSDEFNESSIDLTSWTFETGASGWGNNELQNYTSGENAEIVDGKLVITARKINNENTVGSYTSSRIISQGKREFQYGRIEVRAKLPSGRGIWPAIWMLGGNKGSVGWPACGEIDIMEYVGYQPNTIHSTVHTTAGSGINSDGSSKTLESCEEEFHIYGLLWNEQEMVFYTDSVENVTHTYAPAVKTEDNWPFDQPNFFLFNVAVGGNWGGVEGVDPSIFPQKLEIDYVRVFQEDAQQ